jgi:sterol desaturase/sphingolipid hydroxylase (fatty acid hydroxylase superfamily)
MFGAIGIAIALIGEGVNPFVVLPTVQIPAFLCVIALERLQPLHRSWSRSHGDIAVDAAHTATIALTVGLLQPVVTVIGVAIAAQLSAGVGLGFWPQDWPLAAQLALALVIGEFFEYWVHRLMHEREWLWRLHAVHHSAPRLYWLNAGRFHPLDIALNFVSSHVVLVVLGASAEALVLWSLVAAIHGVFQHSNMKLELGPLNWIFSMAELHRWHHSTLIEESNRNYGQNLIVWDVVFGTRFLPADREPPADIGIPDMPAFPMTYWAHLASPFRWRRIVAESGAAGSGSGTGSGQGSVSVSAS